MHLADLHLGKVVNGYDLIEDQRFILDQILDISDQNDVNVIIIAGDIYDKKQPSEKAVTLFDDFLTQCTKKGKTILAISGNHDSDERLNFGSRIFSNNNIHICGIYNGEVPCVTLNDKWGKINVHLLPFVKASLVKNYHEQDFPNDISPTYQQAIEVALKYPGIDENARNVLVAHQFVAGSIDPELSDSEVSTRDVGTVERIGINCFDAFDYVALGHIHIPQQIGRETIQYSGSPLMYSASELHKPKRVPIIELKGKGDVNINYAMLDPLHKMRHLRGNLDELIKAANALDKFDQSQEFGKEGPLNDYIYVTLTDETEQLNAQDRLKSVYPNLMAVDFDNSRTRALSSATLSDYSTDKSFTELVSDFYKQIYNLEIDKEELDCLISAAKEVGILE